MHKAIEDHWKSQQPCEQEDTFMYIIKKNVWQGSPLPAVELSSDGMEDCVSA